MSCIPIFRLECAWLIIRVHAVQGYDILSYQEKDQALTRKTTQSANCTRRKAERSTYQTRDTSSIRTRRLIPFYPATDRNELCQRSPEDSAFSTVWLPPSAASQGRRRRAHHPTVTERRSQKSCLFETSTSSSDHETMIYFSDSLQALWNKRIIKYKNWKEKSIKNLVDFFYHF